MTLEQAIREAQLLLNPPLPAGAAHFPTHATISVEALRELYEAAAKYEDLQH